MQAVTPIDRPWTDSDYERSGKEAHILSCERCARRKIKCDRSGDGCLNCRKAGVQCHVVARPRLPRGRRTRPSKSSGDLKARLLRLENLVNSYAQHGDLSDMSTSPSSPHAGSVSVDGSRQGSVPRGVSRYVGSQFWSGLSQEITEVREALDSSEDEEDARRDSHVLLNDASSTAGADFVPFGGPHGEPQGTPEFDASDLLLTGELCEIYLYRFSPIAKIGHGPSIRALMRGEQYLDYPPGHIVYKLLSFAVCYAATGTLSPNECRLRFGSTKDSMRQKYKAATEFYLGRADLLTTSDLTVLEAFMIYVVSIRATDSSRRMWTLMATAVRTAQAMGLHFDDSQLNLRPFHREMRRRLWHLLRMFDTRSAYDRGTSKMISHDMWAVPFPLNINDADFSFDSDEPLQEREGYTDMTHALVTLSGSDKRYSSTGVSPLGEEDTVPTQTQSVAWYRELEHNYLRHCDTRVDMQWFTRKVATTMTATGLLFSARPVKRGTRLQGDLSSDSILLLAIDVLEKGVSVKVDPRCAPWDWYTFVPWHALAVALAELCARPSGPLVNKAWPVVEAAFAQFGSRVADSDKGLLWRPLSKLMGKAYKARNSYVQSTGQQTVVPHLDEINDVATAHPRTQQGFVSPSDPNPGIYQGRATVEMELDPTATGVNTSSTASGESEIDWFQSFMEQGSGPTDSTSVGWDQWDAFVQNLESAPSEGITFGAELTPWLGLDDPYPQPQSGAQMATDQANMWMGRIGTGVLPGVRM